MNFQSGRNRSNDVTELLKAMLAVQKAIKNPKKEAYNKYFDSKYATLDAVIETYRELCVKNDLIIMENPVTHQLEDENGTVRIGIEVMLMHTSGQWMVFDPYMVTPDKNTAQGIGAAVTYVRRYTLSSVFNIASEEDDDGNQASGNNGQQKQGGQNPGMSKFGQDRPASEKQMGLLHYKTESLAKKYEMQTADLKAKLGIQKGMSEKQFKTVLKRVQDGLDNPVQKKKKSELEQPDQNVDYVFPDEKSEDTDR